MLDRALPLELKILGMGVSDVPRGLWLSVLRGSMPPYIGDVPAVIGMLTRAQSLVPCVVHTA